MRHAGILFFLISLFWTSSLKADPFRVEGLNPGWAPNKQEGSVNKHPEVKKRKIVLIYYAVDAVLGHNPRWKTQGANLLQLFEKLDASQTNKALKPDQKKCLSDFRTHIEVDVKVFNEMATAEAELLLEQICRPNAQHGLGLVVMQNSFLASHRSTHWGVPGTAAVDRVRYRWCPPGHEPLVGSWVIPAFDDFRLRSQPLAHHEVFKRTLTEVVEPWFKGEEYRWVVVSKTRGSDELAVQPELMFDMDDVSQEELEQTVIKNFCMAQEGSETVSYSPVSNVVDRFNMALAETLGEDLAEQKTTEGQIVGVSKKNYLEAMVWLGGGYPEDVRGVYFPTVVMESFRSDLAYSKEIEDFFPFDASVDRKFFYNSISTPNIGFIHTMNEKGAPLNYEVVSHAHILGNQVLFSQIPGYLERLRAYLDEASGGRKISSR